MKHLPLHILCLCLIASGQKPLKAPKPPQEYCLVMLSLRSCLPCHQQKYDLKHAGISISEDWNEHPQVWLVDVRDNPKWLEGRKNLVPQFILMRHADEWEAVRTHEGTFKVKDFFRLWPELPRSKLKEKRA